MKKTHDTHLRMTRRKRYTKTKLNATDDVDGDYVHVHGLSDATKADRIKPKVTKKAKAGLRSYG